VSVIGWASHARSDCQPGTEVLANPVDDGLTRFSATHAPGVIESCDATQPPVIKIIPVGRILRPLLQFYHDLLLLRGQALESVFPPFQIHIDATVGHDQGPQQIQHDQQRSGRGTAGGTPHKHSAAIRVTGPPSPPEERPDTYATDPGPVLPKP